MPQPETVVLIHGIWMTGLDMSLLHHRLKQCGFNPVQFTYPTIRCNLKDNAARLQRFVQKLDANTVHFVAHSLGGLLLRQFFHDFPKQRPGRVVTLGTPHAGSDVARRMGSNPFGRMLLGQSYSHGLRGDVPPWKAGREIAVFAGCTSVGVGRLIQRLPKPNDGTVAVQETMLAGMSTHQVFDTTHMGLLFSDQVAKATCDFLHDGSLGVGR
ncbi:esterase/lipase family protein [Kaarinaea lacus]